MQNNDIVANSLVDSAFSVQVSADSLTLLQQQHISQRARELYGELLSKQEMLENLYGADTKVLFSNFREILEYAEADLVVCRQRGVPAADYFEKLSRFCGQIEKILRLTRFYDAM